MWMWISIVVDVILLLEMILAWREVHGLLGGYGKGVWSESSSYLIDARRYRLIVTILFFIFFGFTVAFIVGVQ